MNRYLLLACTGALLRSALPTAAQAPAATPARSLTEALTPTGPLRPGAQGAFSAAGYHLIPSPTGQSAFRTAGAGDENWDNSASRPGLTGAVNALLTLPNGDVIAGGDFLNAGGDPAADRIARWNGTSWSALGPGLPNGTVLTLTRATNGDIVAGGTFTDVGGDLNADFVARFNGTTWAPLQFGLNGQVNALTVAANGDIVAGGVFTNAGGNALADRIARFDGTTWSPLANGLPALVLALAVAPNGDILAGGDFVDVGGNVTADRIARFDGTTWQPLEPGLNGSVRALAVASNGDIIAGGDFTSINGNQNASRVARFTGGAWQPLHFGLSATVRALAVAGNGDIIAGGDFVDASGNAAADRVARFTGAVWTPLGTGLSSTARALAVAANGDVLAGGVFLNASANPTADFVARFTGALWQPLQFGLNGDVLAVVQLAPGNFIVGGNFTDAGGDPNADFIARWDGTAWHSFGPGLTGTVRALAVDPNGNVLAGGDFLNAGGVAAADFVARWVGSWTALGTVPLPATVRALVLEANGDIITGGDFTGVSAPITANYLARFKFSTNAWTRIGTTNLNAPVRALALTPGPISKIIAGGDFTSLTNGGVVIQKAALISSTGFYQQLGAALPGPVHAVAVGPAGEIYVGGAFSDVGGVAAADNVLRLNNAGTGWSALGPGLPSTVFALAVSPNGDVFAGGNSTSAGGNPAAAGVARFNGAGWFPLGTGVNAAVLALQRTPTDLLLTGGVFTAVGDGSKGMQFVGAYSLPTIFSLSPASAIAGQTLTITGTGLTGTSAVTFTGGAVVAPTSVSATTVTVVVPATAATGKITLTTPGGPVASVAVFTKLTPSVSSFTPASGGTAGGTLVTITGQNLFLVSGVTFNGVAAASFSANPAGTTVTATTPAGFTSGKIAVITSAGPVLSTQDFLLNLLISNAQTIPAGLYGEIVVTQTGIATVAAGGTVTARTRGVVKGRLNLDGNWSVPTGSSFRLRGLGKMRVTSASGLAVLSGPVGVIIGLSDSALYEFAGSVAQVTSSRLPTTVGELVVDNPAGLTLSLDVSVRRRVNLIQGNLNIGGRFFRLLSNATGTALVVNGPNTAVLGDAVVQRFITATVPGLGYRHMSSPVTNTIISDMTVAGATGYTPVVNPLYNSAADPQSVSPFPTVFTYDESRRPASSLFSDGWLSPLSVDDPMISGLGYIVYMRGTASPDFFGTLGNGNVVRSNLRNTTNGQVGNAKAGWHLLGNPYPAPIDWDLVTQGNGPGQRPVGMDASVSVFKTNGGSGFGSGTFLTRANGVGTLTEGLIAMGQAFFCRVTGTGPLTFTFTNALRTTGSENPAHFRPASDPRPVLSLALHQPGAPADAQDEAVLYAQAGATAGYDGEFDGAKPGRNVGAPTLVSLASAEELAVNGLPEAVLTQPTTIELLLDLPVAGTYELMRGQWANVPVTTAVVLLDRLTGTRYELAAQPTVRFGVSQAGEVRGRFALLFNPTSVVAGNSAFLSSSSALTLWPNPAQGSVQVSGVAGKAVELLDATGRVVRLATAASLPAPHSSLLELTGLTPGVYTVRCGALTQRLVVE